MAYDGDRDDCMSWFQATHKNMTVHLWLIWDHDPRWFNPQIAAKRRCSFELSSVQNPCSVDDLRELDYPIFWGFSSFAKNLWTNQYFCSGLSRKKTLPARPSGCYLAAHSSARRHRKKISRSTLAPRQLRRVEEPRAKNRHRSRNLRRTFGWMTIQLHKQLHQIFFTGNAKESNVFKSRNVCHRF